MILRPGPILSATRRAIRTAGLGRVVGLGFAGGLGLVVASATLVSAADDADVYAVLRETFRLPLPARAAPAERPARGWPLRAVRRAAPARKAVTRAAAAPVGVRYASLPGRTSGPVTPRLATGGAAGLRLAAEERGGVQNAAANPNAGWLAERRTMCVRLCDGYAFPIGRLRDARDLPVHQAACETGCPGAATALFTLKPGADDVMQAVSVRGHAYASLASALVYRRRQVPACSCHGAGQVALPRLPLAEDRTLRPGDAVAGLRSAFVLGRAGFADYRIRSARRVDGLTPRRDLARIYPASPRGNVRLRFARVGGPTLTDASLADSASGVRVVLPAPY
jgi:hypothetical protein